MNFHFYQRIIDLVIVLVLTTLCMSCSTTEVDSDGRVITHNFGYSSISQPPPLSKPIYLSDATYLGFSSNGGITLGYKDKKSVQLNLGCRALIILTDDSQTNYVTQLLGKANLKQVCLAINENPPSSTKTPSNLMVRNFGYSQIIQSPHFPNGKQIVSIRDKTWGISTGSENVVGYLSHQQIYAEDGCIGLILVENKVQFEAVKQSLITLQGKGICLAMQDSQ